MSGDGDDLLRRNLEDIRARLAQMNNSSAVLGGVYGIFSPDPVRQNLALPGARDFKELFQFDSSIDQDGAVLHQDQLKVEALYSYLSSTNSNIRPPNNWQLFNKFEKKYEEVATDLLNSIFGNKTNARKSLGIPENVDLKAKDLWTLILFRLATQRIDGSGLLPSRSTGANDVFQTLWPQVWDFPEEVESQYERIPLPGPSSSADLYYSVAYAGSVVVLHELTGQLCATEGGSSSDFTECSLQFSPPLVLYFDFYPDIKDKPASPFAWSRYGSKPSCVTLSGDIPQEYRIARVVFEDARAFENHPDVEMALNGTAESSVYTRRMPFVLLRESQRQIPFRISFLFDGDPDPSADSPATGQKSVSLVIDVPNLRRREDLLKDLFYVSGNAESIRLDEAERMLAAIERGEDFHFQDIGRMASWLPQQRITNVVQFFDNLFEASSKAVNLILSKGREWGILNMEQTAPIFNRAWVGGIFDSKTCEHLLANLHTLKFNNDKCEPPTAKSTKSSAKKTMRDYSDEEKKQMIDLAIAFKRKYPWATNVVVAHLVARKWKIFKNEHLSRLGTGQKHSKRYKNFLNSLKSEEKSNVTIQQGISCNTTPEDEATFNECDAQLTEYLVKMGVPVEMANNKRHDVIDYLTKKLPGFDRALSDVVLDETYKPENHDQIEDKND